jgi:hypothetical protein
LKTADALLEKILNLGLDEKGEEWKTEQIDTKIEITCVEGEYLIQLQTAPPLIYFLL